MLKKIINACECVDIKIVILLFFVLAIIYASYYKEINSAITGKECNCD